MPYAKFICKLCSAFISEWKCHCFFCQFWCHCRGSTYGERQPIRSESYASFPQRTDNASAESLFEREHWEFKAQGTVKANADFAGEQSRVIGWLLCDSNKLKDRPDSNLIETAKEIQK